MAFHRQKKQLPIAYLFSDLQVSLNFYCARQDNHSTPSHHHVTIPSQQDTPPQVPKRFDALSPDQSNHRCAGAISGASPSGAWPSGGRWSTGRPGREDGRTGPGRWPRKKAKKRSGEFGRVIPETWKFLLDVDGCSFQALPESRVWVMSKSFAFGDHYTL